MSSDDEPRSLLTSAAIGALWVVAGLAWFLALIRVSDCNDRGTLLLVLVVVGALASFAAMGLTDMLLSKALMIAIALSGGIYVVLFLTVMGHCGN